MNLEELSLTRNTSSFEAAMDCLVLLRSLMLGSLLTSSDAQSHRESPPVKNGDANLIHVNVPRLGHLFHHLGLGLSLFFPRPKFRRCYPLMCLSKPMYCLKYILFILINILYRLMEPMVKRTPIGFISCIIAMLAQPFY